MTTIRKTYTPAFKAEVAQEVLKGEKTITQISSQYGVHPNIIGKWKRVAGKSMPNAFDQEGRTQGQIAALKAEHEKEKEHLQLLSRNFWLCHPSRQEGDYKA